MFRRRLRGRKHEVGFSMSHQDKLYRFIFDELDIRGEVVYLHDSWHRIQERCDYPDSVRRQLGEAMASVAILSATIKFDGSLILQIQGKGPLSTLVVQAGNTGKIRGLARWDGEVADGDLAQVYGSGQMAITINNKNGERYQSVVALAGDTLADALEHYFAGSEQLGSRFWLFVSTERVAGLFLQQLPARKSTMEDWERVTLLASTTSEQEILDLSPEALLHRLFHQEKLRLFDPRPLVFSCSCSRRKIENTLFALGRDALQEVIDSEGSVEVDCEFCNEHYSFSPKDVDELFSYKGPANETDILH